MSNFVLFTTVESERVEAGGDLQAGADTQREEEEPTGHVRPEYPSIWKAEQYREVRRKHDWLFAHDGMLGCSSCRDVKNLGVMATCGLPLWSQWAEGQIAPNGHTREAQLTPLCNKIHEHGNSKAHVEVI